MKRQPARLTRRSLLAGGLGATAVATMRLPGAGPVARAQESTHLDFPIWKYGVEIVQDNIDVFRNSTPASPSLSATLVACLPRDDGQPLHLEDADRCLYNGGNWLNEFAAAGWVVPLEDHFDWAAGYQDKVLAFAWQDMTFNGKVYGLPYYADTITFLYNAQILEDAGICAPPETWDEVTEQSLQLKEGDGAPFVYEFANTLPNVSEAFASMVFGRGGELIDEENDPLWTDPESPAAQQFTGWSMPPTSTTS